MMRKKPLVQVLAALALLTAAAAVPAADAPQQSPGSYMQGYYGMPPGMMGGYGMGPGMMGPGMMGGYGPGWGMGGWGMGPGMMGGYGMGPGMMGGWDDWDDRYMNRGMMGPGMMIGPGMMGGYGYGPQAALNLDAAQQQKIAQIQDEQRKKQWDLMGKMNDEQAKLNQLYYSGQHDPAVIGKQYQRIQDLQRQMMESSIEAQNRIEAVLTPEQRQTLRGYGRGGMMW